MTIRSERWSRWKFIGSLPLERLNGVAWANYTGLLEPIGMAPQRSAEHHMSAVRRKAAKPRDSNPTASTIAGALQSIS